MDNNAKCGAEMARTSTAKTLPYGERASVPGTVEV